MSLDNPKKEFARVNTCAIASCNHVMIIITLFIFFLVQTALHLATHTQQTEMIRKLLIAGASLNIADHKGNTPLHIAAQFNSTKALDELLRYVSLRTILEVAKIRNNDGQTCVHIAAKHGNTDTLCKLKNLGVDMDMQVCSLKLKRIFVVCYVLSSFSKGFQGSCPLVPL